MEIRVFQQKDIIATSMNLVQVSKALFEMNNSMILIQEQTTHQHLAYNAVI